MLDFLIVLLSNLEETSGVAYFFQKFNWWVKSLLLSVSYKTYKCNVSIKTLLQSQHDLQIHFFELHSLCFISKAYKQRFYPLVKFLKKISNTTSLFQISKQHYQKIKQQKLVDLNFCLSNSQFQLIYHILQV